MRRAAATMAAACVLAACGGGAEREPQNQNAADPRSAAPAADQPAATAAAVSGQQVYGRTCVTCHQATGQGQPGAFPPLVNSPFVSGDKDRLIRLVLNGITGPIEVNGRRFNGVMPGWKSQLNDAEIAAVLTYVRATFGGGADSVRTEEVREQRAATASRATPYTAAELDH